MNIKKIKLSILFLTTNFHMLFGIHLRLECLDSQLSCLPDVPLCDQLKKIDYYLLQNNKKINLIHESLFITQNSQKIFNSEITGYKQELDKLKENNKEIEKQLKNAEEEQRVFQSVHETREAD